ncbi:MAG: hypothetical protein ABR541_02830 [Candidatus Dormibacteria bacterium]
MERVARERRRLAAGGLMGLGMLISSCAGDAPSAGVAPAPARLLVSAQNTEILVGVDRVSFALFDASQRPLNGARARLELVRAGTTLESRPLEGIGAEYGQIPIYVGTARFPAPGPITLRVHASMTDGRRFDGATVAVVTNRSHELPVGHQVPPLRQAILGTPGVTIGQIDSGVPPDPWHTATIADGLAQHRPMVLYFGQPGFCKSRTCGPTVQVLQQLCRQFCGGFLVEHVEVHVPAGPDETATVNPAFTAFGLQTDPWIYFVNAAGVVSDRFEGPVTAKELGTAAIGTLAGKVPAVDVSAG